MRSALTMLGIVIGVSAVIAMVAVGQGAENQVQQQIQSFGTNTILISAGSPAKRPGGARQGAWMVRTLVLEDMQAVQREVPLVTNCAPGTMSSQQVVFRNQNWYTRLMGTTGDYLRVRDWPLLAGAMFGDDEVRGAQNVAVLGKTVSDILFVGEDPIGQTIRIKSLPFQVVGVLAPRGQSPMGDDQDDRIFVPYTTLQKKSRGRTGCSSPCTAISREASVAAVPQINALLRERHRIRPGEDDDFQVRTQSEVADLAEQTSRVMTLLLGSIASISLLVGGIGIMNIMLVSVTERTRKSDPHGGGRDGKRHQRQFLVER
jgi:putative ABC transport system permease protein